MGKLASLKQMETIFYEEGVSWRLVRITKHAIYEIDTPFGPRKLSCALTPSDPGATSKRRKQVRNLVQFGHTT